MEAVTRRAFIVGGGALAVAVVAACAGGASARRAPIGDLASLFSDRDAVDRIGARATKVRAVGSDGPAIARALRPSGASSTWPVGVDVATLRDQLRRSIDDDVAHDHLVDVAGWQLPLTEARVAALVHLGR